MKFYCKYLVVFIFFVSCSKDQELFIPNQLDETNSQILLSKFIQTPGFYTFDIGLENKLISGDGFIVEIPVGALVSQENIPISGRVRMILNDFSTMKNKLLMSPSTINSKGFIHCESMIYISFSQNEKPLQIAKPINIYLSAIQDKTTLNIFYGTTSDGQFKWTVNEGSGGMIDAQLWEISNGISTIEVESFKLEVTGANQWFCLGTEFANMNQSIYDLQVSTPIAYSGKNSLVYFIADDYSIVCKLTNQQNTSKFYLNNIKNSKGLKGKVVIISDFGSEDYHFGTTNVVIGDEQEVSLAPESKNVEEIKKALQAL